MMSPAGRYTIPVNYVGYSIFILVFEVVGSSNTVLQGLYLLRRKEYHYGSFLQHLIVNSLNCVAATASHSVAHILSALHCMKLGLHPLIAVCCCHSGLLMPVCQL
jgi:hypothetical protein